MKYRAKITAINSNARAMLGDSFNYVTDKYDVYVEVDNEELAEELEKWNLAKLKLSIRMKNVARILCRNI